ncbi:MAG TPA: LLM class F420-dependent oxidoreductase [Streptosporangiaceae bacterium]|nr:LLM class F420-dependent oxidoreductase [Streptosporangiaceae bacterium]
MTEISPAGRESARNHEAAVKVGLHVLGIGNGSKPEVLAAVAERADQLGFATLWCGEHVIMVDEPQSRYPYADSGKIAVPPDADWLDPLLALSFVAACTRRIRLATGILLLPEHNPLLVAKQSATLDVLSGGRFSLGIGIGWSADEFAALGVPFARRGARTAEYVSAIRQVWAEDVASFHGEFVSFEAVRVNPRPVHDRRLPVIVGGTTDAALDRVAAFGDGWYGFNLTAAEVPDRLQVLAGQCSQHGRQLNELSIAVAVPGSGPEVLPALAEAGVTEFVVVAEPPAERDAATDWVSELAATWLPAPSGDPPRPYQPAGSGRSGAPID